VGGDLLRGSWVSFLDCMQNNAHYFACMGEITSHTLVSQFDFVKILGRKDLTLTTIITTLSQRGSLFLNHWCQDVLSGCQSIGRIIFCYNEIIATEFSTDYIMTFVKFRRDHGM
jgi:hypothetical protein